MDVAPHRGRLIESIGEDLVPFDAHFDLIDGLAVVQPQG
jgi:hypothetical protein